MKNLAFTPEEISVIDKTMGKIIFDWAKDCNFFIAEYDRYQKDDEFKKIKIRRVIKY